MICPVCNIEYRDGFAKCSDCGADLVQKTGMTIIKSSINPESIKLVKFGTGLLFFAFSKMMIVILAYEFNLMYMRTHGFIMDVVFTRLINPILWYMFFIEIAISIALIIWGVSIRR